MASDNDRRRRTTQAPAPVLDPALRAELKRLAVLFLVSAITLVLVFADFVIRALPADTVPPPIPLMVQVSWFGGAIATWVYGLYVTVRARAWGWVVLCAIPLFGSVPGCVAYSWIRRGALERQILDEERPRHGR